MIGFSTLFAGIISLIAKIFLPLNIDLFVLLGVVIFLAYLIIYNLFSTKMRLIFQILSSLILLILAGIVTISLNAIIGEIVIRGFSNSYFYWAVVLFIIFSILIYFTFLRTFFNLIKKIFKIELRYLNNFLYLSLAIMFLTLFCGYYYISVFSEDKLRDFLLILSLAFINNFAAVSALKGIAKEK